MYNNKVCIVSYTIILLCIIVLPMYVYVCITIRYVNIGYGANQNTSGDIRHDGKNCLYHNIIHKY